MQSKTLQSCRWWLKNSTASPHGEFFRISNFASPGGAGRADFQKFISQKLLGVERTNFMGLCRTGRRFEFRSIRLLSTYSMEGSIFRSLHPQIWEILKIESKNRFCNRKFFEIFFRTVIPLQEKKPEVKTISEALETRFFNFCQNTKKHSL